jgi:hypothetical protein
VQEDATCIRPLGDTLHALVSVVVHVFSPSLCRAMLQAPTAVLLSVRWHLVPANLLAVRCLLLAGMSSWAMMGCTACTAGLRPTRRHTSLTPWGCAQWLTGQAAALQQQHAAAADV